MSRERAARYRELAEQMDYHAEATERLAEEYRSKAAEWRQRAAGEDPEES